MNGAETCFTDLMSGETILGGDDPRDRYDAVPPLDFRNFACCLLHGAVDGGSLDSEADRDRAAKPPAETKAV
jgi:hypothetical protein